MDRKTRKSLVNSIREKYGTLISEESASTTSTIHSSSEEKASNHTDPNVKKRGRNDGEEKGGRKLAAKEVSLSQDRIGSKKWLIKFMTRISSFPEATLIRMENGTKLMATFDFDALWTEPIIVESIDGLEMKISETTIDGIAKHFDQNFSVEAIDVHKQKSQNMQLREFIEKWNQIERPVIYNIISLEFTGMRLAENFQMPNFVKKLSLFQQYLAEVEENPEKLKLEVPLVENYCLMSMASSYTDYHIDFSGTSVYYHLIQGHKIFFIVNSDEANLSAYKSWELNPRKHEIFFGMNAKRFDLKEGETLLLPSGWIHAVYTKKDSIAFGGNFLNELCVPMQLKVNEIENFLKADKKYRVEDFDLWMMYGAKKILDKIDGEANTNDVFFEAADKLLQFYDKSHEKFKKNFTETMERMRAITNEKRDKEAFKAAYDRSLVPESWFDDLKKKFRVGTGPFTPIVGKTYALSDHGKFYLAKKCEAIDCETCKIFPSMICVDINTKELIRTTHWAIKEKINWFELLQF